TVAIATEADRAAWDAYVQRPQTPRVTGYHEWAWQRIFAGTFGHECIYLMARDNAAAVVGVLPLVLINSWLFGRTMTSLPVVNYGGVVADSAAIAKTLLEAANEQARTRGVGHVELRHTGRVFESLPCKQHKVAMHLPLQTGMWDVIDRKVRNQIRKAEK